MSFCSPDIFAFESSENSMKNLFISSRLFVRFSAFSFFSAVMLEITLFSKSKLRLLLSSRLFCRELCRLFCIISKRLNSSVELSLSRRPKSAKSSFSLSLSCSSNFFESAVVLSRKSTSSMRIKSSATAETCKIRLISVKGCTSDVFIDYIIKGRPEKDVPNF